MLQFDPMALARRQIAIDRQRTRRFAGIHEHKIERMRLSPLAFLRGAAPLFYAILKAQPDLAAGPPGEGWLVGDAHLENFGAVVVGRHVKDRPAVVFDLNDFDECFVGPRRLDVLRVATSLILAGRELGAAGPDALEMVGELVDSWRASAIRNRPLPPPPPPVRALLEQVATRSRIDFLDARTRVVHGQRQLVRGVRYTDLTPAVAKAFPRAFARYIASLAEADRPAPDEAEIIDAAFRIAGTGSLGGLRVAVVVRGKGGADGAWIFDVKEEGAPAGASTGRVPDGRPAERVAAGMRACIAQPPRQVGTTQLLGLSMLGRRLAPQEDKLDLTRIVTADLPALSRYLGALLGNAHRRSDPRPPRRAWSDVDRSALVERAIAMAGIHEAVYLAYCKLTASRS